MIDPQILPKSGLALRYAVTVSLLGLIAAGGLLLARYLATPPQAAETGTVTVATIAADAVRPEIVTTAATVGQPQVGQDSSSTGAHPTSSSSSAPSSSVAPQPDAVGEWPRRITDGRGHITQLQQPPLRIVSLAPSATQILRALGADNRLVAIPREGSDPAESPELTRIAVYPAPSDEAVLSLRPDLVVGADITSQRTAERLRELGVPLVILNSNGYDGIVADIRRAGAATGQDGIAAVISEALLDVRANIQAGGPSDTASASMPAPTVLLFLGETLEYAAGGSSYAGDLLQIAGADNLARALPQAWPLLSREFILDANPQVLVFSLPTNVISFGQAPETTVGRSELVSSYLQSDPIWRELEAVRNGRIYAIDQSLLSVPGPHVGEALLQLHAIVQDARQSLNQRSQQNQPDATTAPPSAASAAAQTPE